MPARQNSAVSSNVHPSHALKEKARTTIKTAMVPKSKSLHPSMTVHESPGRISPPISRSIVTPVEGGELPLDDENLWESLPWSNQRLDRDDSMDGIERVVRNTMSEVFASQAEREKEGKFATTTMDRVPGRYSDEGIDPPSLPVFVSPPAAASRNILSHWPWCNVHVPYRAHHKTAI